MSIIEVYTQNELDQALAGSAAVVCRGKGTFTIRDRAHVEVRDSAHLDASGWADVTARDYATVAARDFATIEAHDGTQIEATHAVEIQAFGRSSVSVSDDSQARLHDKATGIAAYGGHLFDQHGERLLSCPQCTAPVIGWACTNRGIGGSCGYLLCPICADGSGGTTDTDESECHHLVASWTEGVGITHGPLAEQIPDTDHDRLIAAYGAAATATYASVLVGSSDSFGVAGVTEWTDIFCADQPRFADEVAQRVKHAGVPVAGRALSSA
jgi:hypothetical protein